MTPASTPATALAEAIYHVVVQHLLALVKGVFPALVNVVVSPPNQAIDLSVKLVRCATTSRIPAEEKGNDRGKTWLPEGKTTDSPRFPTAPGIRNEPVTSELQRTK